MRCRRPSRAGMRPAQRSSPPAGLLQSPVVNRYARSAPIPATIALKVSFTDFLGLIDCLKCREYFAHMSMKITTQNVENLNNEGIAYRVENLIAGLTVD